MQTVLEKLKIKKASSHDWSEILDLMKETGRTVFFAGSESYEKFYLVRDPDTNKILCSFAIESEDEIAVLKFFGVRKSLQKNGVGKYVANKTCELMKKNGIKRFYASTWEAPEFWRKTLFKEIKISEIKDKYFLNYLKQLEKSFPYEYSNLLVNFCFSA
ncbi:MAG: hypothetical protein A3B68_03620 [Candidatus Melainabacteria bacterium RIFCSPHIGHO2_02_FULL_34_12]|nr:MAG: hypothetical protein A3B68_03620 [Candidatus Melainabacteria bacterium RIFCSPHIGHO2_02_FULL_34_12]